MSSEICLGIDLGSLGIRAAATAGGQIVNLPHIKGGEERFPSGITIDMQNADFAFSSCKNQLEKKGTVNSALGSLSPAEFFKANFISLKQLAEYYFDNQVGQVAFAVPASFPEVRRAALIKIAENCGFKKPRLISDPVAALLEHTMETAGNGTFLIVDSGFSQTSLAIIKKQRQRIQTLSYGHIEGLSGQFFDEAILKGCLQAIGSLGLTEKLNSLSPGHWLNLQQQVQIAKENLNIHHDVHLYLRALNLSENVMIPLTRKVLDGLVEKIVGTGVQQIDEALANANIGKSDLTKIIISGGVSRMESVYNLLQSHFLQNDIYRSTADSNARGAATFAANVLKIRAVDNGVQLKVPEDSRRTIGYDFLDLNIIRTPVLNSTITIDISALLGEIDEINKGDKETDSNSPAEASTKKDSKKPVNSKAAPDLASLWNYASQLSRRDAKTARNFLTSIKLKTDALLQKLDEKPQTNWRIKKAFELIAKGKCEEAVHQSHKAHNANLQDPLVFEDMIKVHIQAASQQHTAESYLDEIRWLECARAHDEGNLEIWQLIADRHYLHALHLQKAGDNEDALTALSKALRLLPGHTAALKLKSKLLSKSAE